MFNYEKLETWQNAIKFADVVYTAMRTFPSAERFGLTNQMRRAAVSISSNLAEGCSRSSTADYARFVELAAGSLFEVVSQATIARNQGFLKTADFQQLYALADTEARMLAGLRKSLVKTNPQPSTPDPQPSSGTTLNPQL